MAATVAITPSVPQAGFTLAVVSGTGFSPSVVLSVLVKDPSRGSNWTTPDGTNLTTARWERYIKTDATGAFTTEWMFPYNQGQTFTVETRPVTEQFAVTTPIATATATPSQQNN